MMGEALITRRGGGQKSITMTIENNVWDTITFTINGEEYDDGGQVMSTYTIPAGSIVDFSNSDYSLSSYWPQGAAEGMAVIDRFLVKSDVTFVFES
jgi:hypothetical protein